MANESLAMGVARLQLNFDYASYMEQICDENLRFAWGSTPLKIIVAAVSSFASERQHLISKKLLSLQGILAFGKPCIL